MQLVEIAKVLGRYLFFLSLILLAPLFLATYDQFVADPALHPQPFSTFAFLYTWIISLSLSLTFYLLGRRGEGRLFRREGVAVIVSIWIVTSILGALPFYLSGTLKNPVQVYFEGMSGFTTTGASVMEPKKYDMVTGKEIPIESLFVGIEDVSYRYYGTIEPVRDKETGAILLEGMDAVSRAIIFWRSWMQWIGGGGIMILFVAVLPALGIGGKVLMQSEVSGPIKDTLTPRIKETAVQLWKVYLSLTALEIGLLSFFNPDIPLFDRLVISLSNISTGGMTAHDGSIGYWNNEATYWIVFAFMILGSINFSLYFFCLKGKFYRLFDPELILFILLVCSFCGFASYLLVGQKQVFTNGAIGPQFTWNNAILNGSFQVISAMTSSGFSITNYEIWPYEIQVLMLITMFVGGMSGSTAGGIKIIRHMLLFIISKNKVESLFRPETVRRIRIGVKEIDHSTAILVLCFFFLMIALSVLGTFIYAVDGIDPETSIGLMSCMINNVGFAFRQAGVMHSFAFLSDFSTLISCFWMLVGRLEIFAVLVLFIPAFWKEEV